MKKTIRIVYIFLIILMFLLTGTVLATDLKVVEPEYTELYKQWLELDDKEKQDLIEPQKYAFNNKMTNKNRLLLNKNITLGDLRENLKASNYSTNAKFSLRSLIPNNIVIKNQGSTGFCWSFATMSSLETNLALENYNNKVDEKLYDYSEKHLVYSMTQSFKNDAINNKGWDKEASSGGNYYMSIPYLTNGSGAINENDLKFDNQQTDIDIKDIQGKEVQTTVNDARLFDNLYVLKDSVVDLSGNSVEKSRLTDLINEMKEHITTNGSIYAGIYMPDVTGDSDLKFDSSSIYCQMETYNDITEAMTSGKRYANHAVSIIGWDDSYGVDEQTGVSKFATEPNGLGAWIIRNSYGTQETITFDEFKQMIVTYVDDINDVSEITEEILNYYLERYENLNYVIDREKQTLTLTIGEEGLYYVSYEDAYIYSALMGIENAEDTVTYDNIYQHDVLGGGNASSYEITKTKDIYLANVFDRTNTEKEYLTSIGIESLVDGTYEVYINPESSDKSSSKLQKAELTTGQNITLTAGYHTINLKNAYELTGENFVIAIVMKHDDQNYQYFTYESGDLNEKITLSSEGESFVAVEGFRADTDWVDIGNPKEKDYYLGNLCIKGITVDEYDKKTEEDNEENPTNPEDDNNVDDSTNSEDDNENEETKEPEEDKNDGNNGEKPVNSNFDNSTGMVTNVNVSTEDNLTMNFTIKINNIEVNELSDKYEHYFYLSSNNNLSEISNDKWRKVTSFDKISDNNYSITIDISDSEIIDDIDLDNTLYVYIKEIATKGTQSTTNVTGAIEVEIDMSDIETDNESDIDNSVDIGDLEEDTQDEDQDEQSEEIDEEEDLTIADKVLPHTGLSTIIVLLATMIFTSIIIYKKCNKYKDIK